METVIQKCYNNLRCNLNGATLNITMKDTPFCELEPGRSNTTCVERFMLEMNLLQILEQKLNFKANRLNPNVYGVLSYGTWSGMFGQVFNGTSEFALGLVSLNAQRHQHFDYSQIIYFDELTFMSQAPTISSGEIQFTTPFSLVTWLLLLISFISMTIALKFALRNGRSMKSFANIAIYLSGIYLKQSLKVTHQVPSPSTAIIYCSWILCSFILSTIYSSIVFSTLTMPQHEKPLDTVLELITAATTDSRTIVTSNHYYYNVFMEAQSAAAEQFDGVAHQIGANMKRTKSMEYFVEEVEENVKRIAQDNSLVMVDSRLTMTIFRYLHAGNVGLHISSESIAPDRYAALLRKGSPLKWSVDAIIYSLRESGIFNYWIEQTLNGYAIRKQKARLSESETLYGNPSSTARPDSAMVQQFALSMAKSFFAVWAVGMGVAFMVMIWEIVIFLKYRLNFNLR